MGCDIHLAVEARQPDGTWQRVERMVPNPYAYDASYPKLVREEWYEDRNYDLFGLLAGVRNRSDAEPIAEGRGLPEDIGDETHKWLLDHADHSYTWFTVREVLAYDLEKTSRHSWLTRDVWKRDGRHQDPTRRDWFAHKAGERGKAAVVEANAQAAGRMATLYELGEDGEYCQGVSGYGADEWVRVEWDEPYRVVLEPFMPTLVRMANLAFREHDGDLDAVRVVCGFDS